jgi:hypothetical protein
MRNLLTKFIFSLAEIVQKEQETLLVHCLLNELTSRGPAIGKPTLTDAAPAAACRLGLQFAAVREISQRLTLPESKLHNTRHPDHIIAFDEPE